MQKPSKSPIRDALSYLEGLGVVALKLDGESVMVWVTGDEEPKASKTLKPHTLYLTASLGEHERIELADVRRLLGFCGATYTPGPVAQQRDLMMAQAGYAPDRKWRKGLQEPTLTIDQLEQMGLQAPAPAQRRGEYQIPANATIDYCHSCDAEIVWIKTAKGKAMPLSVATIERRDGERWALSHFADCEHGKEWKRSR